MVVLRRNFRIVCTQMVIHLCNRLIWWATMCELRSLSTWLAPVRGTSKVPPPRNASMKQLLKSTGCSHHVHSYGEGVCWWAGCILTISPFAIYAADQVATQNSWTTSVECPHQRCRCVEANVHIFTFLLKKMLCFGCEGSSCKFFLLQLEDNSAVILANVTCGVFVASHHSLAFP